MPRFLTETHSLFGLNALFQTKKQNHRPNRPWRVLISNSTQHAPLQPLLVVAGAGTGKTRTVTGSLIGLIKISDANRTMLVTFTQRAASEMKQRLAQLTHGRSLPWVGTFHHLAGRILRDYASQIGYGADFQVADRARCYRMMRTMLGSAPELF